MKKQGEKVSFISATAIISGTAIGAGYLSIPYVISKTGFLPGIFYIVILGLIMLFFKLLLGEVTLRTEGEHQQTGYAEKYLGKTGKYLMFFAMIFGIFSALVAYIIAEGQSISYVLTGSFNNAIYFSIGFWILMCILTYDGLYLLKKLGKFAILLVALFVILLFILFFKDITMSNISYYNLDYKNLFLPFGVILFSFIGFSSIPEARRILYENERLLKKTIIWGLVLPIIFYLIFTFIIVGVFGKNVLEIATFNLGRFFSIIAIITMFVSFFSQSLAIRDMFRFDFNLGRFKGWFLSSILPLVLFLIVIKFKSISFVDILSFAGIISSGLTAGLIILMNKKAKLKGDRKPEYSIKLNKYLITLALIIFLLGIFSALVNI